MNARAARAMNASPMQIYHQPKSLKKPSSLEGQVRAVVSNAKHFGPTLNLTSGPD
jgi:hypothetical protein